MIAGCGHEIDFPFPSPKIVCKSCFEAQGFTYNRNSFRGIDRHHTDRAKGLGEVGVVDGYTRDRLRKRRQRLARAAA